MSKVKLGILPSAKSKPVLFGRSKRTYTTSMPFSSTIALWVVVISSTLE